MDIKQLKYFTYVAELGSYTRASEVIDIAQPVLSRQIRQLEIELRKNLLLRHGRGVILTEAGEKLLKYSRQILQLIDAAQEDLNQIDGKIIGHITLGLPPTLARIISIDIIKSFEIEFPDASLTLTEALTINIEENINLGRIDLGLVNSPTTSPSIQTKLLASEELCLVCHTDYPINLNGNNISLLEIANIPLILPSTNNTFRVLLEKEMLKYNLKPNIAWEIDSVGIIIELVASNIGCAILPASFQNFIKQKGIFKTIPINSSSLINHIYIASSSKRSPSKLHNHVALLLENICKKYFESKHC